MSRESEPPLSEQWQNLCIMSLWNTHIKTLKPMGVKIMVNNGQIDKLLSTIALLYKFQTACHVLVHEIVNLQKWLILTKLWLLVFLQHENDVLKQNIADLIHLLRVVKRSKILTCLNVIQSVIQSFSQSNNQPIKQSNK